MNLFFSCLTQPAPSANYRGESEQNRAIIQKITIGEQEYPVISPEAIRNALREMLQNYGLPCNRHREHNEDQLAVSFEDYPNAEKFVDDFYFGYMVANRKEIKDAPKDYPYKRDSVLRNNLAVGLTPYRYETLFTQSPKTVERGGGDKPKWKNAGSSQLLHREMTYTAYQFPVALNLKDCKVGEKEASDKHKTWFATLLQAFSELNGVAGNHARSYFEMSPVAVIARTTNRLASGFPLYPYLDGEEVSVITDILSDDLPGSEFVLGGNIVKELTDEKRNALEAKGAKLFRTSERAFNHLSESIAGMPIPGSAGVA
jgi:CRISPR-associated protein Cst2